ncbi:MAG: hypothetical protein QXZ09_10030 [Candidatus Methanomethylicaceae archaeon]
MRVIIIIIKFIIFVSFSLLSIGGGCALLGKDRYIANDGYMTIKQLFKYCESRGLCNGILCCEGETVKVKGYLDFKNIVHRSISFNTSRPKFRIFDGPNIEQSEDPWRIYTNALEIYPISGDVNGLFEKLGSFRGFPLKVVYVIGVIKGVDAYTERGKRRLIKLEVKSEDVFF